MFILKQGVDGNRIKPSHPLMAYPVFGAHSLAGRRVVVVGTGNLPITSDLVHSAQGLRSWQIASGLARAGASTHLLLANSRPLGNASSGSRLGFDVSCLDAEEAESPARIRARLLEIHADAIVGATSFGSLIAARSALETPLWVDFNGDPWSEGWAAARTENDPALYLRHAWLALWALDRGDRFSVVSARQRHFLLGQLAVLGRLGAASAPASLVHVVPEAFEPSLVPSRRSPRATNLTLILSGSLNAWFDIDTFVRGLEIARQRIPSLRVVVTGGSVAGHLESPYRRFSKELERLRRSGLAIEQHGWVDPRRLLSLEEEAHVGVVAELPMLERELGGLNRTLRWMARGIAIVTSDQTEFAAEAKERRLGLVYRASDPESLACCLEEATDDATRSKLIESALRWLSTERSIEATTRSLVEFCSAPIRSVDRIDGSARRLRESFEKMCRDQRTIEQETLRRDDEDSRSLDRQDSTRE